MVTIDPEKSILNITEQKKTENRSHLQKGEFDAIFKQAVDSTEDKGVKMESTPFMSQIRPGQFATESLPSTNVVVDRVQQLIDTMGVYQQKLIDSGATLKDIQPLVEEMTFQSESLGATSSAVEGQESLKTIVNQSLTLASMEITKFNSGYYND
ncbi:hypothetical protein [uncultured Desulfosarcina sp.]|uniref:hypothetical protein n=1 Tax=uncultured Desulfosarcina sp. TaxID=218289 RepID=UPI0029C77175|nr:hypothetical protein [uncultured Desulfosarcina sp.]